MGLVGLGSGIACSSWAGCCGRRWGSVALARPWCRRQVLVLELLDQPSCAIICLILHKTSSIHLVGSLRGLQVLLVGILLLSELRVLLSIGMIHEIPWLRLVRVGGCKVAREILLLTVNGLGESRRRSWVETSIGGICIVVELEVQAQSVVVVHGEGRGVCFNQSFLVER